MRGNNLEGLVRVPSSCCFSGKLLSWTTGLEWAAEYADLHPPASLYNLSSSQLPKTIPSTRGSHNVSTMPVEEWHRGMGGCVFFFVFFLIRPGPVDQPGHLTHEVCEGAFQNKTKKQTKKEVKQRVKTQAVETLIGTGGGIFTASSVKVDICV